MNPVPERMNAEDYEELLVHLGRALEVFDRRERRHSSAEISAKSMLAVLHAEIRHQQMHRVSAARDLTLPPFGSLH